MIVKNMREVNETKIETYPYRGKTLEVKNVWIRWLSQAGPKDAPEYGLRFFTIGPKGAIPIHNHAYHQTMYILSGRLLVTSYDAKTDEKIEERTMGSHDFVYVPSMEPHSISNLSDTENATFLCCIGNVCEEEGM